MLGIISWVKGIDNLGEGICNMRITSTIPHIVGLLSILTSLSYGSDIYIAQNSAGTNSGADCSNAHSVSWFNSNATGGNIYHLCGTFTGTAGSTMLTPPSGASDNVLTILFESGAVMSAPYWGGGTAGAINIIGKGYIIIDGGMNGVIKNTANGTALAYHQASQGIYISNSNNIEIKNLTIQNIYANGGSNPNASDTNGINTNNILLSGNNNNISINNNTLTASRTGVRVDFDRSKIDKIDIHNNIISDHCWGIMIGAGSGGESATNVSIHGNEITDYLNWQCPANAAFCTNKTDAYHTDGIILYQPRGNATIFSPKIYNNYIHGDLGAASPTAYIYCTYGGGAGTTSTSCIIYNNLLVNDGAHNTWLLSTGENTSGHLIYNNTLIGRSSAGGTAMMLSGTNITVKNNIVVNVRVGIGSYKFIPDVLTASNNNVWYNINSGSTDAIFSGNDGGNWYSWSQWQALGFDANSSIFNPQLNASYQISSASSSAYRRGANLTGESIPFLDYDKSGIQRPVSGPWDAGVYQSSGKLPFPPSIISIGP